MTIIIVCMKWKSVFLSTQFRCVFSYLFVEFPFVSLDGRCLLSALDSPLFSIVIKFSVHSLDGGRFLAFSGWLVFSVCFSVVMTWIGFCFSCWVDLCRLAASAYEIREGAVAWIFVISCATLNFGHPRYEAGCSPPQFAHFVSDLWNCAPGSFPTLSQFLSLCLPAHMGHFSCCWHAMALCP